MDKRLTNTLLCALRHWQKSGSASGYPELMGSEEDILTNGEIDMFCEDINCSRTEVVCKFGDQSWTVTDDYLAYRIARRTGKLRAGTPVTSSISSDHLPTEIKHMEHLHNLDEKTKKELVAALNSIAVHDSPGFSRGTCAKIATDLVSRIEGWRRLTLSGLSGLGWKIVVEVGNEAGRIVSSNLGDILDSSDHDVDARWAIGADTLVQLVLAHARFGVDVQSGAYIDGLDSVIRAICDAD